MVEWKHIDIEGVQWEVRAISHEQPEGELGGDELLEFRPSEATLPPRRVTIQRGALDGMTEESLRSAFVQSRPIGGDFYGRPGKRMSDAS